LVFGQRDNQSITPCLVGQRSDTVDLTVPRLVLRYVCGPIEALPLTNVHSMVIRLRTFGPCCRGSAGGGSRHDVEEGLMRRSFVVAAVTAIATAACTVAAPAPTVPPPTLPNGIGVSWLRDVGGTNDPNGGSYTASYDRYVTTSSATTGPTAAGSVVPSALVSGLFGPGGGNEFPDGTAKFPWNGFAGEGITTSTSSSGLQISFPGGSCQLGPFGGEVSQTSVMPSPDGTKAAVLTSDISYFIPLTIVRIVSLVDGSACPTISTTRYGGLVSEPEPDDVYEYAIGHFVWSPNSTSVVYPVAHHQSSTQPDQRALDRLDASPGATPQRVLQPVSQLLLPMGWSIADRLLVSEIDFPNGPPTATATTLFTVSTAGTGRRVVDTATINFFSPYEGWDYGYYVPGTTSIVYAGKFATVTNGDGYTFPRFRIQLIADQTNAMAGPLDGTPPLVWHQVPINSSETPTMSNAPNQDVLERFTH
jgi:hypothetical protein